MEKISYVILIFFYHGCHGPIFYGYFMLFASLFNLRGTSTDNSKTSKFSTRTNLMKIALPPQKITRRRKPESQELFHIIPLKQKFEKNKNLGRSVEMKHHLISYIQKAFQREMQAYLYKS